MSEVGERRIVKFNGIEARVKVNHATFTYERSDIIIDYDRSVFKIHSSNQEKHKINKTFPIDKFECRPGQPNHEKIYLQSVEKNSEKICLKSEDKQVCRSLIEAVNKLMEKNKKAAPKTPSFRPMYVSPLPNKASPTNVFVSPFKETVSREKEKRHSPLSSDTENQPKSSASQILVKKESPLMKKSKGISLTPKEPRTPMSATRHNLPTNERSPAGKCPPSPLVSHPPSAAKTPDARNRPEKRSLIREMSSASPIPAKKPMLDLSSSEKRKEKSTSIEPAKAERVVTPFKVRAKSPVIGPQLPPSKPSVLKETPPKLQAKPIVAKQSTPTVSVHHLKDTPPKLQPKAIVAKQSTPNVSPQKAHSPTTPKKSLVYGPQLPEKTAVVAVKPIQTKSPSPKPVHIVKGYFEFRRLPNINNSCYMNAALQALVGVRNFVSRFRTCSQLARKENVDMSRIFRAMNVIIGHLTRNEFWNNNNKIDARMIESEKMRNLRRACGDINMDFASYDQQDTHEFIYIILQHIDEEFEKLAQKELKIHAAKDWDEYVHPMKSKFGKADVTRLFKMYSRNRIACNCGAKRFTPPVKNFDISPSLKKNRTIQQLVEDEMRCEKSDAKCESCSSNETTIANFIDKLPEALMVSLKRYRHDSSKIDTKVGVNKYIYTDRLTRCFGRFRTSSRLSISSQQPPEKKTGTPSSDNDSVGDEIEILDEVIVKDMEFRPLNDEALQKALWQFIDGKIENKYTHSISVSSPKMISVKCSNFSRMTVRGDGNCFYRCISKWLSGQVTGFDDVRKRTYRFMKENAEKLSKKFEDPASYAEEMKHDGTWSSEKDIMTVATMLQLKIYTFVSGNWIAYSPIYEIPEMAKLTRGKGSIYLSNPDNFHFDIVNKIKESNTSGNSSSTSNPEVFEDEEIETKKAKEITKIYPDGIDVDRAELSPCYELSSVICHYGLHIHSGHYFSYVHDHKLGVWICCNDDVIERVSEETVYRDASQYGYIFFYSKVVIPTKTQ